MNEADVDTLFIADIYYRVHNNLLCFDGNGNHHYSRAHSAQNKHHGAEILVSTPTPVQKTPSVRAVGSDTAHQSPPDHLSSRIRRLPCGSKPVSNFYPSLIDKHQKRYILFDFTVYTDTETIFLHLQGQGKKEERVCQHGTVSRGAYSGVPRCSFQDGPESCRSGARYVSHRGTMVRLRY